MVRVRDYLVLLRRGCRIVKPNMTIQKNLYLSECRNTHLAIPYDIGIFTNAFYSLQHMIEADGVYSINRFSIWACWCSIGNDSNKPWHLLIDDVFKLLKV